MARKSIIYIAGMFEDETSSLFLDIQTLTKQSQISCRFIKLYPVKPFGSYSFQKEIQRIGEIISKRQPSLLIAHSLGCYIAMHLPVFCPFILLDPSISIADIILSNISRGIYDDGEYTFKASSDFLNSIKESKSINILTNDIDNNVYTIDIFGAGKGGYKIAEEYHQNLTDSDYFFFPNAEHKFEDQASRREILQVIKKRLDTT